MAVVTPLNNFLGPEGDTVTVPSPLLSPKHAGQTRAMRGLDGLELRQHPKGR